MTDVISQYQKWKEQGESLRGQAKQAMESRFRELLSEAVRIAEEYRADFGVPLKRRHRIVEHFNRDAARIPGWIDPQLIRRVVAGEPQLTENRLASALKRPSQHTNISIVANDCAGDAHGGRAATARSRCAR